MNNQGNKEMNSSNSANTFVDIDALVFGLEKEDDRNLKMTRNFRWFLVVMAVLYTLLMVVNPDPELKMHHRISGLCYVAAFTLFAVVFAKINNEFRNVDYSLTSVEMLQQAAKRYKFLSWRYIWMLPSLLLIDAGISITYFHRWISVEPLEPGTSGTGCFHTVNGYFSFCRIPDLAEKAEAAPRLCPDVTARTSRNLKQKSITSSPAIHTRS